MVRKYVGPEKSILPEMEFSNKDNDTVDVDQLEGEYDVIAEAVREEESVLDNLAKELASPTVDEKLEADSSEKKMELCSEAKQSESKTKKDKHESTSSLMNKRPDKESDKNPTLQEVMRQQEKIDRETPKEIGLANTKDDVAIHTDQKIGEDSEFSSDSDTFSSSITDHVLSWFK